MTNADAQVGYRRAWASINRWVPPKGIRRMILADPDELVINVIIGFRGRREVIHNIRDDGNRLVHLLLDIAAASLIDLVRLEGMQPCPGTGSLLLDMELAKAGRKFHDKIEEIEEASHGWA